MQLLDNLSSFSRSFLCPRSRYMDIYEDTNNGSTNNEGTALHGCFAISIIDWLLLITLSLPRLLIHPVYELAHEEDRYIDYT